MIIELEKTTIDQIRKELKGGEKDLPDRVLETIYEKKLFRLFIPAELGGLQLSLPEALQVIKSCSHVDGDFGWQVNIGSGGGFFAGYMDPAVVRERFISREFVIAGSGYPSGEIRKEGDGYLVNGSWNYCSGCSYATLFTFTGLTPDGEWRAFALTPDQVRITKNWNAYGLSATTSHTVTVEHATVPEEFIFDVTRKREGWGYPLYDYPFIEFARASFFAVITGCYTHFLDEIERYSSAISDPKKVKHQTLNRRVNEKRQRLNQELNRYEKVVERSWSELLETGQPQSETLETLNTQIFDLTFKMHQSAAEIVFYTGMEGVKRSSPINKVWRDLSTACQHSLLKP
ncbi:MAG: hypothetical protein ACQER4_08645 [Bacteroidota bacterium]